LNRYRREQLVEYSLGVLMVVGTLVGVIAVLTVAGRIVVGSDRESSGPEGLTPAAADQTAQSLLEAVDAQARDRIEIASVIVCVPVDDRFLCRITATNPALGECVAPVAEQPARGDRVRAVCDHPR
jgi:hypothetical protein